MDLTVHYQRRSKMDLTVQDVHNFVNAINAGRMAVGLPILNRINYDQCDPGDPQSCLSARHLFNTHPLVGRVGNNAVRLAFGMPDSPITQLAYALDTALELVIPDSIKAVTDVFDSSRTGSDDWHALRELFVEAGYVED